MYFYKPKYKAATGGYRTAVNYAVAFQNDGKRIVKSMQTPNGVAPATRNRPTQARLVPNLARRFLWRDRASIHPTVRSLEIHAVGRFTITLNPAASVRFSA